MADISDHFSQKFLGFKFLVYTVNVLSWIHVLVFFNNFIGCFFVSAEEESGGWGPVLASLQVPELTVDDFLSESQSGGSFLTLYAFILQRLNTEYTAANERRTLALINTWTNQVFPRYACSYTRLFGL